MFVEIIEILCVPFYCIVICCGLEKYCDYEVIKESQDDTPEYFLLNNKDSEPFITDFPILENINYLSPINSLAEYYDSQDMECPKSPEPESFHESDSIQMTLPSSITRNTIVNEPNGSIILTHQDPYSALNIFGSEPICIDKK